jgi:hypothetical protein
MLEESVQTEAPELWVAIPGTYEKWVHPGSKEKHYRAIFRSTKMRRKTTKIKFKTATAALEFADRFNKLVCTRRELIDAIRGQGDHRTGHQLLPS